MTLEIDDRLALDILSYLETKPLKETYGIYTRLALAVRPGAKAKVDTPAVQGEGEN